MTCMTLHSPRELNSRINDGILVRLLWCETDGSLAVAVDDRRTGDSFTIPVREGQSALDVFHHPYAYAASPGIR